MIHEFTNATSQQLPELNKALEARKLPAIAVISEDEWRKTQTE